MSTTKKLVKTIDTSEMDATGVLLTLFDLTVMTLTPPDEVEKYGVEQHAMMGVAKTIVRDKIESIRHEEEEMQNRLLSSMGTIVRDTLGKIGITAVPLGENVQAVEIWQEVKS